MTAKLNVRATLSATAAALLAAPAAAQAYTVTVHVHGAGTVSETTARHLPFGGCPVGPGGKSETSVTDCVAGSPTGVYNYGDIVNIQASVPLDAFNRGWRFQKFVDSGAGAGQINCDPQGTTGDSTSVDGQSHISETLPPNLSFDDISGPRDTPIEAVSPPPAGANTDATTAN